tara:strand:+ start:468 stop:677 length:210 start_codon:yes stop_codon:yes gene_type:complete
MTQMACSSSGIKNITLERNIDLQSVDLTKYAESGFLVTPHGYGGDYDALAFFRSKVRIELLSQNGHLAN